MGEGLAAPKPSYGVTLGDSVPLIVWPISWLITRSGGISPPGSTGVLNPSEEGRRTYGKVTPVSPSFPEPFAAHGKSPISQTTFPTLFSLAGMRG